MTVVEQLHLLFGTEAALRSLKANNVELVKKKKQTTKKTLVLFHEKAANW